jgi:hypothetical protein
MILDEILKVNCRSLSCGNIDVRTLQQLQYKNRSVGAGTFEQILG